MEKNSCGKSGAEVINPYDSERHKGEQVEEMFDSIAPHYDLMNTAMTGGLHRIWRNRALRSALRLLGKDNPEVLDVATGTGDVAFRIHSMLPDARVTGIDLSGGMLAVAEKKLASMGTDSAGRIAFRKADCLSLPFPEDKFDLITVAYGVRNFENLFSGLKEMKRVLRPGGVLCIVELSCPEDGIARKAYDVYTKVLIPAVGKIVSGDPRAYSYLPESIAAAPQRDSLASILKEAGFRETSWRSMTMGAVTYYLAQ